MCIHSIYLSLQIFDSFVPCVQDSNSKVNLFALQAMRDVAPLLADHMASVTPLTVKAVAANLASKNPEIHDTAKDVLDTFTDSLGRYIEIYADLEFLYVHVF